MGGMKCGSASAGLLFGSAALLPRFTPPVCDFVRLFALAFAVLLFLFWIVWHTIVKQWLNNAPSETGVNHYGNA